MKLAIAVLLMMVSVCLAYDTHHGNPCECGLERDTGNCCKRGQSHCYASKGYFYYDSKSGQCRPLLYKGCGGNANKFYGKKACMQTCRKGRGNVCEVCPPPSYYHSRHCGCYKRGQCECQPGYYCCPVMCGDARASYNGYMCRKPIQKKCASGQGHGHCNQGHGHGNQGHGNQGHGHGNQGHGHGNQGHGNKGYGHGNQGHEHGNQGHGKQGHGNQGHGHGNKGHGKGNQGHGHGNQGHGHGNKGHGQGNQGHGHGNKGHGNKGYGHGNQGHGHGNQGHGKQGHVHGNQGHSRTAK